MSKELPYFKFYPNEWITGDITLEDMQTQGLFVNVCALYWSKDCRVAMAGLRQRYGGAITRLLESGILKEKDGFAIINFLDEQYGRFNTDHQILSKNGKLGAEKRWAKNGHPIALRGEERRGKEKRGYKIFTPPLLDSVIAYFKENGYSQEAGSKAWNYYNVADWKDSKGKQVKNWKQKMQGVWFKEENKDVTKQPTKMVR